MKFSFLKFIRLVLNIAICSQLVIYPSVSFSQTSKKIIPSSQHLNKDFKTLEKFNEDVVSLREKLFGDNEKVEAHPLDFFRLLDQELVLSPRDNEKTIEETKKIDQNKIKKSSLLKRIYSKPLNFLKEPIPHEILPENLFFEIKTKKKTKAFLTHGNKKISLKVLPKEIQKFYASEGSYISKNKKSKHQLDIIHRDQVLHSFDQNIKWITTIDSYVVFLDSSTVSEDKISLSFINLDYFSEALGKTTLPVFKIPLHIETKEERQSILSPSFIEKNQNILNISGFEVSVEQIWFLSRLQELNFNLTVSLVDPNGQVLTKEAIGEIVSQYTQNLKNKEEFSKIKKSKKMLSSFKEVEDLTKDFLSIRSQIGSTENPSGPYGRLRNSQSKIRQHIKDKESVSEKQKNTKREKQEVKMLENFSAYLSTDRDFQSKIQSLNQQMTDNTKLKSKVASLMIHLMSPQPLGAPKIQRAFGLIANTVLPGETPEGRLQNLKEGFSQLYSYRVPRMATAVLVGMGLFAFPESSIYFYEGLSSVKTWFSNFGEIFAATGKSSFAFTKAGSLYNAYFEGQNAFFTLKGLTSLFVMSLLFIGSSHLSINLVKLISYLKSGKHKSHLKESKKSSNLFKRFISFQDESKKQFVTNLAASERRKIGLTVDVELSNSNQIRSLIRTGQSWNNLVKKIKFNEKIQLEMSSVDQDGVAVIMNFTSLKNADNKKLEADEIRLHFHHNHNETISQVFKIHEKDSSTVNLNHFIDLEKNEVKGLKIDEQNNIQEILKISFKSSEYHFEGNLLDINLSEEENRSIEKVFESIRENKKKPNFLKRFLTKAKVEEFKKQIEVLEEDMEILGESTESSVKEIKSLSAAIAHLFVGYSSWTNTFKFLSLSWNKLFLIRNFVLRPTAAVNTLFFSEMWDRVYVQKHQSTKLNGGYDTRIRSLIDTMSYVPKSSKIYKIKDIKPFKEARDAVESKIIEIEKKFLQWSVEQAFMEVTLKHVVDGTSKDLAIRKNIQQSSSALKKKSSLTFEVFQRTLLQESVKDFLKDRLGLSHLSSDKKIKKEMIRMFKEDKFILDKLVIGDESKNKKRVSELSRELNILEKSEKIAGNLLKSFSVKNAVKIENKLNPSKGIMMKRYAVAEESLKDPETMSRTTRYMISFLLIDKPIELGIILLLLAGAGSAGNEVLQVLYEEPFSENSFFHLSKFAIWYMFFAKFLLEFMATPWLKVQMDSRLAGLGGFDDIPTLEDVQKKFSLSRWFVKNFRAKGNSLWENQKFVIEITIANIGAAIVLVGAMQFFTIGRFDLDAFIGLYLFSFLFFNKALRFKLENAAEKTLSYALKPFIKAGIDFKKHSRLLADPRVQAFKLKESAKLRPWLNLFNALAWTNLEELLESLVPNKEVNGRSRAFIRQFFGGFTPTEHYVHFLDYLESKGVPGGITEKCKLIFTNNKTDLQL